MQPTRSSPAAMQVRLANATMLTNAVSLEDYAVSLKARLGSTHGILAALIREPGKVLDLCGMIDNELEEQGA